MDRRNFLRGMFFPVAGAAAAVGARTLDPGGEPIPEWAPLIVIKAPGTTISNFSIDAGERRGHAIHVDRQGSHSLIQNGFFNLRQGEVK